MKHIITITTCLTLTALLHTQTTIYVTPNGTGDGTSWENACNLENAVEATHISTSLNDHVSPLQEIQIWVQKGTYHPTKMLVIAPSVKTYGGFAGTETALSQRNFSANPTIIDGQNKIGSIFRLENSAELNGFTIQNGNANGTPHHNGGGVWADENTTIQYCTIVNNTALVNGGGVYAKGNLVLVNSHIENNTTIGEGSNVYGNCITNGEVPVLTINPKITVQSVTQEKSFAPLSVVATGSEPLSYQWFSNTVGNNTSGTLIPDATEAIYTPSNATFGTLYYYCKISNAYETAISSVSGAHTVVTGCKFNTFDFGTVSFASATERTISGNGIEQIWSDAITATKCQKTGYNGGSPGNYNTDCRTNPAYPGDLFSWCAVVRYADVLCPAPWRVPNVQDFVDLDIAMGGTGINRVSASELSKYLGTTTNRWGGVYGGYCETAGQLMQQKLVMLYYTPMEANATAGRHLYVSSCSHSVACNVSPRASNYKRLGTPVRCVRDN